MRQTSGTQDQGEGQGDEVELAGQRATVAQARLHDVSCRVALLRKVLGGSVCGHGLIEEGCEATADGDEGQDGHDCDATDEQDSLDHLDVGGALHTAEEDIGDHDDADDTNNNCLQSELMDVQQDGDQGACTGHLGNEIEEGNGEGAAGCGDSDWLLTQAEGQNVRHGEAAHVTQRLSDQEEGDEPGDEEADGVQEAVVTGHGDRADDAEERSSGEVVTGDREAVLGA